MLNGIVPPTNTKVVLDLKDEAAELTAWPEFHNAVASGLKLASENSSNAIHTRNWIMYHKPEQPKHEFGGFLLAMGLLGHLDTLLPTDIYQYLKIHHDSTTVGLLLGRAASKIGTMDDSFAKTLCLHIPYLLPQNFEIDISLTVQSAAVVGAGLLFQGTNNRLMTEVRTLAE